MNEESNQLLIFSDSVINQALQNLKSKNFESFERDFWYTRPSGNQYTKTKDGTENSPGIILLSQSQNPEPSDNIDFNTIIAFINNKDNQLWESLSTFAHEIHITLKDFKRLEYVLDLWDKEDEGLDDKDGRPIMPLTHYLMGRIKPMDTMAGHWLTIDNDSYDYYISQMYPIYILFIEAARIMNIKIN